MGGFLLESRVCYKKNAAEQIQHVSSSSFKLFLLLNFKCLVQLINLLVSFWLASLEVELGTKHLLETTVTLSRDYLIIFTPSR